MIFTFAVNLAKAALSCSAGSEHQLLLNVALTRMKAGIFKFKGEVRVDSHLVCEAELMCTMRTVA